MIDFFGLDKTIEANQQIITSEFASLSAGGLVSLVQSVNMNYSRQLQTMFEAGSSTVFYISGNSEGQLSMNAAVGVSGFFTNFNNLAAKCGAIDKVSIDLLPSGACSVGTTGGVTFSGALAEGFQVAFQAGPVAVTEGATIRIPFMNIRAA